MKNGYLRFWNAAPKQEENSWTRISTKLALPVGAHSFPGNSFHLNTLVTTLVCLLPFLKRHHLRLPFMNNINVLLGSRGRSLWCRNLAPKSSVQSSKSRMVLVSFDFKTVQSNLVYTKSFSNKSCDGIHYAHWLVHFEMNLNCKFWTTNFKSLLFFWS